MGISIVNSLLTHNTQVNRADITSNVTAFNRQLNAPHVSTFWSPSTASGRAALDAVIKQQAQVIAYNNDYKFMMFATLATLPLLVFLRKPTRPKSDATVIAE